MKLVAVVLAVCLLGGCTKRAAGIGAGVGAGFAIAGVVVFSVSPDGNSAPSDGQLRGGLIFLGGVGMVGVSLIALVVKVLKGIPESPSRPSSPTPAGPEEGRRCEPTAPDSSWWTCGEGYRCTDEFEDCELANGLPALRQR